MYLNSDYCYMVYKDHYQDLLRASERSRLLRSVTREAAPHTNILHRIGAAAEGLLRLFHRRDISAREVIQ